MKNHITSFFMVIMFLAFFSTSIFTNFNQVIISEIKESKLQYINPLETQYNESPLNPDIPGVSLLTKEDTQIDIDKMNKEVKRQLDKNTNRITDDLEEKIRFHPDDYQVISVIVTTKTNIFQDELTLFMRLGGIIRHIWDDPKDVIYGFSGEIESAEIKEFSNQAGENVDLIEENFPTIRNSDVATHLAMVRTYVWDKLNYTGDPNLAVAILDSGIDDSHPVFSPGYEDLNWSKKIVGWYDATSDSSTTPDDYIGHGSHVAGIVAANSYNNTYDDGRIVSTWSYSKELTSESLDYNYVLWVNRTGTIDVSYVWRGEKSAQGTHLELYAPNGTLMVSDTSGNSNMTVSQTISSFNDYGYWVVALGCSWGVSGGVLDIAGVNKYPYPDPVDNHSRFAGVAPDVKLVGVKIFDKYGDGYSDDVIEAFTWVKNNKATYHIAIASGSFSFSSTIPAVDSAAAALVNSGVSVVLSAGNDGQGSNLIYSPGQVDGVITVAASNDYDNITTYSSEGPGETSNTTKPDITAPGGETAQGGILQVDTNDADSDSYTWSDNIPNDFTNIQGTSMSCPFVSGSLALLIQAMGGYANWKDGYGSSTNPFKIKQLILMSANEIYSDDRGGKNSVEGYGRLNIYAAIEAIENTYEIGTIANSTLSSELGTRKVWVQNVILTTKRNYTFELEVPDGADFDLFLYEPDPNQYGEPVLAANSTDIEPGEDENITYVPETGGTYYLVVKSSFTNNGSGTFNITSNSILLGPIVIIDSPTNNTYSTSSISVYAQNVSTIHTAWYRYKNGSWSPNSSLVYNPSQSRWEAEGLTWIDGSYSVQVFFNDSAGYENFSEDWFTVDTTAPTVTIIFPTNTTYTTSEVAVYATNSTPVHSAWYRYKNGSWSPNSSLVYNPSQPQWEAEGLKWVDGSYLIQVFFNDSVGNEAFSQECFTIDTTPPIVNIDSPANQTYSTDTVTISLSGNAHNIWYHVKNIDTKNHTWISETNPIFYSLDNGIYTLHAYGNDSAGLEVHVSVIFTVLLVDIIPPIISLEILENESVLTSNTLIVATISDSYLDTVLFNWNGDANQTWLPPYETFNPSNETENVLFIYANDTSNNWGHKKFVFTSDDVEPKIILLEYLNRSVLASGTEIVFEVNDPNLDTVIYNWDGSQNNTWFTYKTALPEVDGQHVLYVFANDTAGNSVDITYVFYTQRKETTETSSVHSSSQEESSSVYTHLSTLTSEDTQAVLPEEVIFGVVLGALFALFGLILIMIILRRLSST